jgi:predicted thioesterase
MNTLQKLGALFFEEQYSVPVRLNGNLATSAAAAPAGATSFAAGSVVEVLERMCQQRVIEALADPTQSVTPSQVALVHRAPALPGAQLFVRGWVQRVGWDVVSFELEVRDRFKLVCEGTLTLALQRAVKVARPIAVPPPMRRPAIHRPSALIGFLSPAMAGRALPVLLWAMASVLLFAITLFALRPGLEQQTARAVAERGNALNATTSTGVNAQPQLSHPLSGTAQEVDARGAANTYGG